MSKTNSLRTAITASGSFISLPEAFEGADAAVKLAPKVEFRTSRFPDSSNPLKMEHVMFPHSLLVDLEAVDASSLDIKKLIRDCDLVKDAAEKHPEDLKAILASFAEDAPHEKMLEAAKIAEKIGLAEHVAAKKGAGLLWLVVIVAAVALSGCKSCAHTKGATRQGGSGGNDGGQ